MLRRGLVPVVVFPIVAALLWGVARLAPRSPVVILVVCVLGVVAMKLIERRVQRWFRRWEEMDRRREERSGPKSQAPGPRSKN